MPGEWAVVAQEEPALVERKAALRKHVKALLRGMPPAQMKAEDEAVVQRVLASDLYKNSERVGVYVGCARLREVNSVPIVQDILQRGKKCYVPRVMEQKAHMRMLRIDSLDELVANSMTILEPEETDAAAAPRSDVLDADEPLDLLLMPGLAFDMRGHRLGRGGGYYDAFVAQLKSRAASQGWSPPSLVALAYKVQIVDEVPVGPLDKPVDAILTADELHPVIVSDSVCH
eukprot:jgi/Chlat1/7541/Chrsp62S07048